MSIKVKQFITDLLLQRMTPDVKQNRHAYALKVISSRTLKSSGITFSVKLLSPSDNLLFTNRKDREEMKAVLETCRGRESFFDLKVLF